MLMVMAARYATNVLHTIKIKMLSKAQFTWARKYEKDKAVAKFLMEAAMRQGYNAALQYLAVDRVKDELLPNAEIPPLDNFFLIGGLFHLLIDKLYLNLLQIVVINFCAMQLMMEVERQHLC